MKRLFAAALLACTAMSGAAQAHFIDGYLAECSAVAAGSCTEFATAGYARQPVFFNATAKGATSIATPYTFGGGFSGTVVGRAIYDAPTGGNLLLVMPLATPLVTSQPGDAADVGSIKLNFTVLANYQYGEAYSGAAAAAAVLGTTGDGSALTAGVALYYYRGILSPQTTFP